MAIVPRLVVAGVVASAAATTLHVHPTSAADECLAKPKGAAPAGQHWYYHNDRATKRQCWYLDETATHGASLSERKSAAVHRRRQLPQETADAHAEYPSPAMPTTDVKRDVADATPATAPAAPPIESAAAPEPAPEPAAAASDQSSVASRWPDAAGAVPSTTPTPSANAGAYAMTAAAPTQSAGTATYAMAAAEPTTTASVNSTAETTPAALSDSDTASVEAPPAAPGIDPSRTRLFALLGGVALAGFSTSVLLARARARRRIRLEPVVGRRRVNWPADAEIDHMRLPEVDHFQPAMANRDEPAPRRRAPVSIVPRDDVHSDEQYEIEDLLARFGSQGRSAQ
jgi:hypothetical protein